MQNAETRPAHPAAGQCIHSSSIGRWTIFVALALIALAVRLPQLGERPVHTDEAVNAYLTGQLLAGESFHYDPRDRHGPVLYLLAKPVVQLCGAKNFAGLTETQLRLTPVIAGSLTVLLFGAGVEMFGFITCLIAALLFVIAPLPVYYSRYFIHETLFVAVTLGLILSGWYALNKISVWFAALAGLCAALLVACKETAVIHFFALAVAMAGGLLLNRRRVGTPSTRSASPLVESQRAEPVLGVPSLKALLIALGVFVVVTVLLFSWFGRNWRGLADLFRIAPHLAARAAGEGHEKPFGYYFTLLNSTIIFFPLALVGIYAAIRDAVASARKTGPLLAIYGVMVFLIYSAIPYKTPWLALNFWLPLALLCGLAVESIWKRLKKSTSRWVVILVFTTMLAFAGRQTKTLAFDKPADEKNPLAYAHTVEDLLRLPQRLEQLTTERKLTQPVIAMVATDPWPLPWYLRKFSRVDFWQPEQNVASADFYITSTEAAEKLGDKLKDRRPEFFGLRAEVVVILWPPKDAAP
jgi:uncharacterized protein (TIGR03663 family)